MSKSIYEIPVNKIDGTETTLAEYKGQVLLVVNVASKCGLTKQYDALEALYQEYKAQGLQVLGFPSNDFAGQEPGTEEEIQEFCKTSFGVQFPMFSKIEVKGEAAHPLYQALTTAQPTATGNGDTTLSTKLAEMGHAPKQAHDIQWNFEKFLVGRDGQIVARFAPNVTPDDAIVKEAIEKALKQTPVAA